MPEMMGLLGSGRENRSKTRSSQMSELVQGRVQGGPQPFLSSFPKKESLAMSQSPVGRGMDRMMSRKKMCARLTPGTCEYPALFGIRVFEDIIKNLEVKSARYPMSGVLYERTHRGRAGGDEVAMRCQRQRLRDANTSPGKLGAPRS